MLTPISDDNSDRVLTPYINYLLIIINALVFIFLQQGGNNLYFTYAFATVPAEILTGTDLVTPSQLVTDPYTGQSLEIPGLQPTPVSVYLTLLTSMFMHGGWGHLIGNMLYLYIFGDNLENRMGHGRYLAFYLLCGLLASLAHVYGSYLTPAISSIPSLGASGAISGVLGGNLLLFPGRKVNALLGWMVVQVPVLVALGLWIVFQVISGLGMLGGEAEGGGVAYGAHIGGFLAGLLLVKAFVKKDLNIKKFEYRR